MTNNGEAHGKAIILDTLKKFTDLMDKSKSSQFGDVARKLVAAGGSIICLAHVNKKKDDDGKSIYAGTSDIRDDADCCYTIEHIRENQGTHTVEFENTKARGRSIRRLAVVTNSYRESGSVGAPVAVGR